MTADQAHAALTAYLQRAGFAPQDRLPAERALAARIGCSRATLRVALDRMEAAGQLWRHVGQGTFYGARPRGGPLLREPLLIQGASPQDLMQARLILEPAVAAAAARLATAEDVTRLRARVQEGRQGRDRAACEQADDAFHRAIAAVAGNPVLIGLMTYLSGARRRANWQRQWETAYRRLGVDEFRGEHSDQHQAVVDAIARSDPDGAAAAMRHHLRVIEAAMSRD